MAKKEHIGFQLIEDRPVDKKVMDILNSLPKRVNKCAFIREAIIFYSEHKDTSFEKNESGDKLNDEKMELVLKKLDGILGLAEMFMEREAGSHPSQPAPNPVPESPQIEVKEEVKEEKPEEQPVKKEKKQEEKRVKDEKKESQPAPEPEAVPAALDPEPVQTEELNTDAYLEALGDFLG